MKYLILLFLSLGLMSCSSRDAGPANVCFEDQCIRVEVVMDRAKWEKGLMGRASLGEKEGMLFYFPSEDYYSFWMKGMRFPIDIIWLNEKKQVVHIETDAPPCLQEPCSSYSSSEPGRYVLEVNAQMTQKMGIKKGDTVDFR